MNGHRVIENRQDRLLAFFDAILAIAMTVLALEITVPELGSASALERYDFFEEVTCYLTSFVALGTLWFVHNNFFSTHSLTGRAGEIVLHLVLLFVITLFQPLTRAVGTYPDDLAVRALYLLDFFVMYGLMAIIFVVIRRRESAIGQKKRQRTEEVKQRRDSGDTPQAVEFSDEHKELHRMLQLAYTIEHPEEVQQRLAESMPDEYKQELAQYAEARRESYRLSLWSVVIMAIAVAVAVVVLMFSAWYSYVALGAGLLGIFLLRRTAHVGTDSE